MFRGQNKYLWRLYQRYCADLAPKQDEANEHPGVNERQGLFHYVKNEGHFEARGTPLCLGVPTACGSDSGRRRC